MNKEEKLRLKIDFLRQMISALQIISFWFGIGFALAQSQPDLTGTWEGAIEIPGAELGVIIDFKRETQGAWQGEIDIPLQSAKDLPLANIKLEGKFLSFDLPNVPGNAAFKGEVGGDGNTISGTFTQSGGAFPFQLKRKTVAEAQRQAEDQQAALEKIRAFVDSTMKRWNVPGLALAIVKNQEVIFSEGFGQRNVKEKLPVTPNTLFAIGSSTKAFTAMTIGILVDDGKVEWDKPVRDYLPTFKLHDEFATLRMTPRDLVTHRSGLPRHDLMWYGASFTRKEMFDRLQYLEPSKDFRAEFQYQNLMYLTAGYLVGQVAGGEWEDFVRARIFTPLGMTGSNFSVKASQQSADCALPYEEKNGAIKEMPFRDLTEIGPAGSINSNLADMSKWVMLNLNRGKFGETQVISEAGLAQMHTPHMIISQPLKYAELSPGSYGLGWFIQSYRSHNRVAHGGNIDGFSALVTLYPQDARGWVILTNRNGNPLPGIVSNYVADIFFNLEPIDWNSRVKAEADKAKEAEKKKEAEQPRKPGTKPAHAWADYAGEYEHPAYGVMAVTTDGKALKASFNAFTLALEHWHYEVFRGALLDDKEQKYLITFLANEKGDVDRLAVPLELAVKSIVFTRKPAARLSDPKYLERFAGEYELAGQTVTVALKAGKTVTLTVPGQPQYELEPYKEGEFNLKGLTGFSVKFTQDQKDVVTSVVFYQPNGVFTATKKK